MASRATYQNICPEVSRYLTSQFYERNYNLSQRLDILEVLGAAAQELSQPVDSKQSMEQERLSYKLAPTDSGHSSDGWREIVKQRVESKTRRFPKGATKEVVATKNRFGLVAGCFFYPLMANFDSKGRHTKLRPHGVVKFMESP
uniref:Telomere length regulation protein TEL2-like protein n=1 Tax=Magallana gigas TaxID=29159 RepID=K1PQG7_MAGGI